VQSKIDYLIVGQGLAGSLLGCLLEMSGLDVLFVDDAHRTSASISAAGIMNPITGKRLNRPHLIDDLLDTALRIYPQINMTLGASFFQERTVLRLLQSETEAKQWKLRLASGDYGKYVNSHLPEQIGPFGGFEIKNAGHLDVPRFVQTVRDRFLSKDRLVDEAFDYAAVQTFHHCAIWRQYKAKAIIFCEGYKISKNPFFNWIALNPAKGEILTLQAPDFNETRILQGGKWLFKTQCGEIKAGTTYSWDWLNETPTAPARDQIEQAIPMLTRVPYRVIKQSAGVRPVIRLDNRPIIGRHPIHHSLAILNGLGSKGVLQAPFAAEQLIMHMEKGAPIHPDFFVCRDLLWQAQRNG
jgi:glycine/D-amino acid oxidase-like deaminating enzyme